MRHLSDADRAWIADMMRQPVDLNPAEQAALEALRVVVLAEAAKTPQRVTWRRRAWRWGR